MKAGLTIFILIVLVIHTTPPISAQQRIRDYGIITGVMEPGELNAITDVAGVAVGHVTLIEGEDVRTGVTAIVPHSGNIFQEKVPAAIYVANGFGKLAGSTQVNELGNIETPIVLTNTLAVGTAMNAVVGYVLDQDGNADVRSVNAVVGETNDGTLNNIRSRPVTMDHVLEAIQNARGGPVEEGNVGAGTGTRCFGYKGGIGTASRRLPESLGGYTVGVLVQSNFGGTLRVNGVPLARELKQYPFRKALESGDGSCMIVVATDAPLDHRNLGRLAQRAMLGLGNTGGISSNGSGDYVIAFSTAEGNRYPYQREHREMEQVVLHNDATTPIFMAAIEATEEAILNSLSMASTMTGYEGKTIEAWPIDEILKVPGVLPDK